MSLRIFAPLSRHPRFFEDGDIPLSAKIVDDDYFLSFRAAQGIVLTQPIAISDEFFVASFTPISDEDLWFEMLFLGKNLRVQPQDIDEDVFPHAPPTIVDEDGFLITVRPPQYNCGQPLDEDEVLPNAKNFGIDEDAFQIVASKLFPAITKQQFFGDDELPTIVITIVDEDGFIIASSRIEARQSQPLSDDEVSGIFKNFGLEDDPSLNPNGHGATFLSLLQFFGDDDLPQIVVTAIDEEGSLVQSLTVCPWIGQPLQADEEILPHIFQLEESIWFPLARRLAKNNSQPFTDDEVLGQFSKIVDEDTFIIEVRHIRTVMSQPIMDGEIDLNVIVKKVVGGRIVQLASYDRRIQLTISNTKISLH